ncbi:MAG TPA: two-component sensor histidine kinase, partial [Burkholderiaceae bacterium]|nr:two-component sensor histidine kinase [Burkholderiaceae bacterium]
MRSQNLRESFWRTLLTFNVTRVVIAIMLLLYVVFSVKKANSDAEQFAYWQTCIVYLLAAIFFAVFAFYYRA